MSGQRPLKVALLIGSMREGGAEGDVADLAVALRGCGHQVRVFLLRAEGPRLAGLLASGVPVLDIALPRCRPWWNVVAWFGVVAAWWRTLRQLRVMRADVLHAWLFWAHVWAWLVHPFIGRTKLVTSRVQLGLFRDGRPWMTMLEKAVNRRAGRIVANSRAVARDTRRREAVAPIIIHGGIDPARADAAPPADLRALFPALTSATRIGITVANLFPYKGYFDIVEAWPRVLRSHPGAALLCVGADGGIEVALRERIRAEELQQTLILAGSRADVLSLVKGADFFVLASHEEGFPKVLLEAAACSRAIAATAVGGNPELVRHGETGVLFPPRNPEALAAAVCELAGNPDRCEVLGNAARALVEKRFTLDRFVSKHEKLYRRLAGKRASA